MAYFWLILSEIGLIIHNFRDFNKISMILMMTGTPLAVQILGARQQNATVTIFTPFLDKINDPMWVPVFIKNDDPSIILFNLKIIMTPNKEKFICCYFCLKIMTPYF